MVFTDEYPQNTVKHQWPYASILFVCIRSPISSPAPCSLIADEVYALTAYILSQDAIIDFDLAMPQDNLPLVTMPNRDGLYSPSPNPENPV